ncbi:MAG: undecaprenyl/decaprenyl-phosphate alpha-N-acetylglucosaminyl 1-phosphate transferase [Actinobacteria bacterium]|jgi:UDP-GlcNAc:undecaprenyl-phosphate GlcNAc-1-phosphate transferase|nr:undecaprenyl/decaprenyl-phosphate alpha-N-acetylglucosaminyl 1-phosphate transferase [Actinomycetota bacterium]
MLDRIVEFLKALGIAAPDRRGWVTVVLTFLIALLAAWLFNPGVRRFSLRVGWADKPNARRLNKEPLPNAGGLAIFAAVIVALVIATLIDPIGLPPRLVEVLAILLGGAILILTGFVDDQYGLPPILRLLVQIMAALLLVSVDIRIDVEFGGSFSSAIGIILTVIWIVAITNVVNFLDGVDGLAGGVSFITAMSLLAVSAQDQAKAAATLLLAALGGAALGFLRHNFPPSRIIMGDSGAYFFGFVLAASSILGDLKITTLFGLFPTVFFMLLPFLIPIGDTIRVILRRLLQRRNPLSSPGRDHLHHRLLERGLSQTRTTLILWGLTLVTNVVAMIVQKMSATVTATTAIAIIIFLTLVVLLRRRAHRKELRRDTALTATGDS